MTRDRTGEEIDPDAHACRNGWLSAHDADIAVPCPICRPHAANRRTEEPDVR